MVQETHSSRAIQVSRWLLSRALFLNNLDLYKINQHKPISGTVHEYLGRDGSRLDGMSLQNNSFERQKWKQRCHRLISIFTTYYMIKISIINTAHFIWLRVNRGMGQCPSWWSGCQETLLTVKETLGDPMSELDGGSIFFTWALVGLMYVFVILLPYYFQSHDLDLLCLRFYYEPEPELDRVDGLIELKVNELLESILNYHANQCKVSRKLSKSDESIAVNRKSVRRIYQQLISYKSGKGLGALKPNYFNEPTRMVALSEAAWILNGYYFAFICWIISVLVPIVIIASRNKCETLKLKVCSMSKAFNLQEYIYLTESLIISLITYVSFAFFNAGLQVQLRSNLRFVANMREDLQNCLSHLRTCNASQSDESKQGDGYEQDRQLEIVLLNSYVRILVASDELRRGAQSITQLLSPWFIHAFVLVSLFILVDNMNTQGTRNFNRQILFTYWLLMNLFAALGARISSQSTQLQRLYWSIHAELIVYHQSFIINRPFISLVWHRLSYYSRSISHLYSAQPVGIVLTYQRIIEINFSIISVITLLAK